MRIFCSICKELFIPYSEINATSCGHLYHSSCILRWLKQHKTCPRCRSSLTSQPIRVYFDVDKDNELDASTLEHQLETVTSELRQSQIDNKILREKNEKIEKSLNEIEDTTAALKRKSHSLKASVQTLKNQIITLTEEKEKAQCMKKDLEALKTKMRAYEGLEHIITCTAEEANKLMKITPITEFGLRQLSIYTSALKDKTEKDKKKLLELANEKKQLQKALAAEQMKNSKSHNADYKKLKRAYDALNCEFGFVKELLQQSREKVTNCENENSLIQNTSQSQKKKRPLFAINVDFLEKNLCKVKKPSATANVSESIKHWENLVAAGPSKDVGFVSNKSNLSSIAPIEILNEKKQAGRAHPNYAFDGMGGSKKIYLGQPTPQNEFCRIKTDSKLIDKTVLKNKKDINVGKVTFNIGKHKNFL